jgi:hypothetical protein
MVHQKRYVLHHAPTTQDIAIVLCGGGDPMAEFERARALCRDASKPYIVLAGNDQIEHFPEHIDHAVSLHPEKAKHWLRQRAAKGWEEPPKRWAHRPYPGFTNSSKDWQGSTGLLCAKIARELGYTHVVLCGVHMSLESNHFVRKAPWKAANGFRRGWVPHLKEFLPYVRSFGGWTLEQFGEPTAEWISADIPDNHRINISGKA